MRNGGADVPALISPAPPERKREREIERETPESLFAAVCSSLTEVGSEMSQAGSADGRGGTTERGLAAAPFWPGKAADARGAVAGKKIKKLGGKEKLVGDSIVFGDE